MTGLLEWCGPVDSSGMMWSSWFQWNDVAQLIPDVAGPPNKLALLSSTLLCLACWFIHLLSSYRNWSNGHASSTIISSKVCEIRVLPHRYWKPQTESLWRYRLGTVMFLSFRTGRSGQTVQTQIRGAVWSGSTPFAILYASFGLITLW